MSPSQLYHSCPVTDDSVDCDYAPPSTAQHDPALLIDPSLLPEKDNYSKNPSPSSSSSHVSSASDPIRFSYRLAQVVPCVQSIAATVLVLLLVTWCATTSLQPVTLCFISAVGCGKGIREAAPRQASLVPGSSSHESSLSPGSLSPGSLVPGSSTITSTRLLRAFRERHACLATRGRWRLDPDPRLLPWKPAGPRGRLSPCDAAWTADAARTGHVAGGEADEVAERFFREVERFSLEGKRASVTGNASSTTISSSVEQGRGAAREWRVRETVKYRWVPDASCGRWEAVDGRKLIELIKGRRMLVVGDSISGMSFCSLWNHLLMQPQQSILSAAAGNASAEQLKGSAEQPNGSAEAINEAINAPAEQLKGSAEQPNGSSEQLKGSGELQVAVEETVPEFCKERTAIPDLAKRRVVACSEVRAGDVSIVNIRDDLLSTAAEPVVHLPQRVSIPWFDQILPDTGTSILVINRGAHYVNNSLFIPQLNETLTKVRAAAPDLLLIYRSSSPGHMHCEQLTAPLRKPQDPSQLPYHWGISLLRMPWPGSWWKR
ncbi:hypothetical protein CLOM_g11269 [Closterium sp. NIES-68]|nr:hypothetical protein CLOM_g13161 [Closterium sp. NIES-68]GJP52174.1 hypothetical protein CLOM_g11269 [Closterium sp. NIES-68]